MFQLLNAERWTGLTLFLVPSLTVRMMAALVWQGTAGLSSWGRIASDSSERMIRTEVLQSLGQFRATCHFEPGNHGLRAVCRAPWLGDFWRRLSCCALETPRTSSTGGLESRAPWNQTAWNRTSQKSSMLWRSWSFVQGFVWRPSGQSILWRSSLRRRYEWRRSRSLRWRRNWNRKRSALEAGSAHDQFFFFFRGGVCRKGIPIFDVSWKWWFRILRNALEVGRYRSIAEACPKVQGNNWGYGRSIPYPWDKGW